MAMNPRDAANAKGCIDAVMSFTKTKLLPHVPEIAIRSIHSVENRKTPMPCPKSNSAAHGRRSMGKAVGRSNTIALLITAATAVLIDRCLMAIERMHVDVVADGKRRSPLLFTADPHR